VWQISIEPETYYLTIDSKQHTFQEGKASEPVLTINTPLEVWLAITQGYVQLGRDMFVRKIQDERRPGLVDKDVESLPKIAAIQTIKL